jgi:diacylglycerol O-acyltransferase
MLEIYPVVPLLDGLGLGIALFSYDGKLCWGVNADWDLVPDLDRFVTCVEEAFDELRTLARRTASGEKRAAPVRRAPKSPPAEPPPH